MGTPTHDGVGELLTTPEGERRTESPRHVETSDGAQRCGGHSLTRRAVRSLSPHHVFVSRLEVTWIQWNIDCVLT